jgi:putative tRNA adenosine deaminase-associated protein
MAVDDIDYVVAAWRESGQWSAAPLPPRAAESLENLIHALRQLPGEGGVIGLVSIVEDVFVVLRVNGSDVRICMSDATAGDDFEIAAEIVDLVGNPFDEEADEAQPTVVGDLGILADLGMKAPDLLELCEDGEEEIDDVFAEIAESLGFAKEFERARDEAGR